LERGFLKESGEKWASPQEYAELSIEPESEVITCFSSHVAMSMKTGVGVLGVQGMLQLGGYLLSGIA
jgi:hypothetical protein